MNFKKFWNLSFYLAKSGFKIRNEGSYLGIFWYLLGPLLFFLLLWIIFSKNIGARIENYPLYLFLGIMMFNFFQSVTSESISVIRDNRFFFKSINFPRASFITGSVLKFLFSHILEFIIFIFFVVIFKGNLIDLLLYPLVLIFFTGFILGVSLLLGSTSVYFIDMGNIWAFALKLLWFATPLFYATNSNLSIINLINPLYYFITAARDLVIYGLIPEFRIMMGVLSFSILFFVAGVISFNKLKYRFTEVI